MNSARAARTFALALTAFALCAASAQAAPYNTLPKVEGGWNQSCAISQMGLLICMGDNSNGQLGPKNAGTFTPVDVPTVVPAAGPVVSVSLGLDHSCLVTAGGAVQCRGDNQRGELGSSVDNNTSSVHSDPITVPLPAAALNVSVNQDYSCAALVTGAVYCWGVNNYGQLGNATNNATYNPNPTPALVSLPGAARSVTTVLNSACALMAAGNTYCWGTNFYGEMGTLTNSGTFVVNPPTLADKLAGGMKSADAGISHACFVSAAQTADCIGSNQYAQLSGTTNNGSGSPNPVPISAPIPGGGVTGTAATFNSSCALTSAGEVWCYGDNYDGELGNSSDVGANVAHPTPAKVAGLPAPAIAVGAGATHVCAALQSGALACWGNNGAGQLGQPVATLKSSTPLTAPGVNLLDAPGPITLKAGKVKLKYSKSGKKIRVKSTIKFTGSAALSASNCSGKVATSFFTTRKVGKKTKTKRYSKQSFKLGFAGGSCRIKLSQKLSASAKGKKLKLSLGYAGQTIVGASDISPYAKTLKVKVPRSIR